MTTEEALPTWDEMGDLDKGAALIHVSKREHDGDSAIENWPTEYFEHPDLLTLDPAAASQHAMDVAGTYEQVENRIGEEEASRLYDLALDTEITRYKAIEAANADRKRQRMISALFLSRVAYWTAIMVGYPVAVFTASTVLDQFSALPPRLIWMGGVVGGGLLVTSLGFLAERRITCRMAHYLIRRIEEGARRATGGA